MNLKTVTIPGSKTELQFGSGEKSICNYGLTYSYIGFSIPEQFTTVFSTDWLPYIYNGYRERH